MALQCSESYKLISQHNTVKERVTSLTTDIHSSGFEQKSDRGFSDFNGTKLLAFPRIFKIFFQLYVNKNIKN